MVLNLSACSNCVERPELLKGRLIDLERCLVVYRRCNSLRRVIRPCRRDNLGVHTLLTSVATSLPLSEKTASNGIILHYVLLVYAQQQPYATSHTCKCSVQRQRASKLEAGLPERAFRSYNSDCHMSLVIRNKKSKFSRLSPHEHNLLCPQSSSPAER